MRGVSFGTSTRATCRWLVILWSGWWKLNNLQSFTSDFAGWGIVYPQVLAPFVAGLEFFGGILLLLGLFTRIIAVPLAVVMVVATVVDKAKDIDSLAAYTDLIETVYMAVFIWLAVAGAGAASLDRLILQRQEIRPSAPGGNLAGSHPAAEERQSRTDMTSVPSAGT